MLQNASIKQNTINLLISLVLAMYLIACSTDEGAKSVSSTPSETTVTETTTDESTEENTADHEEEDDYVWESSDEVSIVLSGDSITENSDNVTVSGTTATIKAAGTYTLSGTLDNGQILVDADGDGTVRLVLNGVSISNSTSSAIFVNDAEKAIVVLTENTVNTLTDAASYVYADATEDEPNAALFSKSNLTIYGGGTLQVTGNYNDGIASKDGLIIDSAIIDITAVDDGIRGKDYLIVREGIISISAGGDGLKSDNEDDTTLGYISVESGELAVIATGDAIQAQTDVIVSGGVFNLKAGGGSGYTASSTSAKGIKAGALVVVDAGEFTLNTADDAIHSNGTLTVNGGTFAISSGDDGIHADTAIAVNDGDIVISKSYEGVESAAITVNGGDISVVSTDDGINAAGGTDSSSQDGRPGQNTYTATGNYYLHIYGGSIYVNATGDGIDINGAIVMTAGTVIVNGPTSSANGALDYDSTFTMNGGFLVAAGSSGMLQAPSSSSGQNAVAVIFSSARSANTLFNLQTSSGSSIVTFAPAKSYQAVVISAPGLTSGTSYSVYTGGSSTGTAVHGLYENGTYTPGTRYATFTLSNRITSVR